MAKWPKMISTKDMAYISDMFNWNNTLVHKINYYLDECNDEELCCLLKDCLNILEDNCNKLVKLLESE